MEKQRRRGEKKHGSSEIRTQMLFFFFFLLRAASHGWSAAVHAEFKREGGEEILGCQKAGSQGNKHQMQACQGREGGEKGGGIKL